MLCRGVLEGGGGATIKEGGTNRLPGLVNRREQQASWFSKQQAVEFPQVLTSVVIISLCIVLLSSSCDFPFAHTVITILTRY